MDNTKKRLVFWLLVIVLYSLLLVQVRRYRDGSDWFFFVHLTNKVLSGDPLSIYEEQEYGRYYFYYSPLSLFLLAPAVWLSKLMQLAPIYQQIFNIVPFAIFDILMAYSGVRLISTYRRLQLNEQFFITSFILFSYFTLWSTLYNGRFESVMIFFLLTGWRWLVKKRLGLASLAFMLAILVKQTAVFALVPVLVMLIKNSRREGFKFLATVIVGIALVFLPFFLHDPSAFLTAMKSQFQSESRGFTVWNLGSDISNWSGVFIMLLILITCLCVWKSKLDLSDHRLFGWAAFSVIGIHLLMNTVLSYYFVFPIVFLFLWEMTAKRYPIVSLIYLGIVSMIHTLGMSVETTVYTSGVLTSTIALVLGIGSLLFIGSNIWSVRKI
ncbi:MAG: hypothetical protein UV05_C0060G0004 [candidate division CPR1 bacterium GW2011_GWA2_42_17]|uniref:DUF2029 domain-containing protein n=1 Tax=candidate division CPR1 bacterium GW2011_GWA2_42_17 TaxID=1618341 RepID=A0A0G0YX13_9BACT|nr:MAG: hypothetical protein UV05_C0060G0004 [candidate division CPR1 bacterium GW2011_GWA2_42_17]